MKGEAEGGGMGSGELTLSLSASLRSWAFIRRTITDKHYEGGREDGKG